jgi:hypothetical protein
MTFRWGKTTGSGIVFEAAIAFLKTTRPLFDGPESTDTWSVTGLNASPVQTLPQQG